MDPTCHPSRMLVTLELKRAWWEQTAILERARGNGILETMALKIAALYDDAIRRVRLTEQRMEHELFSLWIRGGY